MIPLKFGLFWSGSKMSLLRFLTFLSLRKNHPNAEIELYVAKKFSKNASWVCEKQDFQTKDSRPCYIKRLKDLDIKVIEADLFPTYSPNYQSDLFRWWWLYNNGGFYLDTDQIILKPFDDLPLNTGLIYSIYRAKSCGIYAPVGVVGATKESTIVKKIMNEMPKNYNPGDYNSLGPFMFRDIFLKHKDEWEKSIDMFNAPPNYFYPVAESCYVSSMYKSNIYLTGESYALHWYGGNPKSQEYNNTFTEESLSKNEDTISILARPLMDWYRR